MTSEALIRELATNPKFRILSELGREIVEKVWDASLQKLIEKADIRADIKEESKRFREALEELDILTIEGRSVGTLTDRELYEKVVFPVHVYFIRQPSPKD